MPNHILWHIGVRDVKGDQWTEIVKEQAKVLVTCDAQVYVSLHATLQQAEDIGRLLHEIGLTPAHAFRYEQGIWEVEGIDWFLKTHLPTIPDTDMVAYVHTLGVTHQKSRTRWYIMDHLFVRFQDNIDQMRKYNKVNAGVFGVLTPDFKPGVFWCSCWIATADRVRKAGPLHRERDRWASETFMIPSTEDSLFLDHTVTVIESSDPRKTEVPFYWKDGARWEPSATFKELTGVGEDGDTAGKADLDNTSNIAYIVTICVLGALLLVVSGLAVYFFYAQKSMSSVSAV